MHEVSLVHALFDQIERAISPHPCRSVRLVTVRIGALAGVDGGLFRTAFDGCRADRGCAEATLEIVEESAAWRCASCAAAVAHGEPLCCASCGAEARLFAGGEIILDRVELEVVDV